MAWTPAFQAKGAKPVIRQLLAIVQRDMQAALDYVSGAPGSLKVPVTYQLAEEPAMNFPAVRMMPARDKFDINSPETAGQTIPIICAIAVEHQNPQILAKLIEDYALALWHVLTAAFILTSSDFTLAGLELPASAYPGGQVTAGLPPGALKLLFVEEISFGELRRSPKGFIKAAGMQITCELIET